MTTAFDSTRPTCSSAEPLTSTCLGRDAAASAELGGALRDACSQFLLSVAMAALSTGGRWLWCRAREGTEPRSTGR